MGEISSKYGPRSLCRYQKQVKEGEEEVAGLAPRIKGMNLVGMKKKRGHGWDLHGKETNDTLKRFKGLIDKNSLWEGDPSRYRLL